MSNTKLALIPAAGNGSSLALALGYCQDTCTNLRMRGPGKHKRQLC